MICWWATTRSRRTAPPSTTSWSITPTAHRSDAAWFQPQTSVAGARRYLAAWDMTPLITIAVPSCFRNNNLPAGRGNVTEQTARALTVMQVVPETPLMGTCSPSSCAGCCSPTGQCLAGTTTASCGVMGERVSGLSRHLQPVGGLGPLQRGWLRRRSAAAVVRRADREPR